MKTNQESIVKSFDINNKLKERFIRILQQHIKDKEGVFLDAQGILLMYTADPTKRGKYLRWMTDLFKHTSSNIFFEDLYKVTESLELFEKVQGKLNVEERNILNYNTLADLWDRIKKYKDQKEFTLSKKQLNGDTPVDG